jgi:hypothetical protein
MPKKLKPIEEVIANAQPLARGTPREADPPRIAPTLPPQPPPKDKR